MPRNRKIPPPPRSHRWYLAEWAIERQKRQADAIRDLGWSRSSASDLWTGKQRYTQDHVDEVARWLGIAPYELLMPPAEAMWLRRLRDVVAIAAEDGRPFDHERTPRKAHVR
jgi:hypothetical protein